LENQPGEGHLVTLFFKEGEKREMDPVKKNKRKTYWGCVIALIKERDVKVQFAVRNLGEFLFYFSPISLFGLEK